MKSAVVTAAKNFINLIYPIRCAACGNSLEAITETHVCGLCMRSIRPNPKPHCVSCGRSLQNAGTACPECRRGRSYFERAYSACLYEGVLKELIHRFKYKNALCLMKVLRDILIDFLKENGEILDGIDIITSVPLSSGRMRKRGFNQSRVLAYNISKEFGMPYSDILKKTVSTRHQNELSREERLVNLKGAFKASGKVAFNNLRVLLVDDVMTTGATLNECSRTLLDSGAKSVRCLTLARGM